MPREGDQITSSIRLVRELGSGGMGSVWVADHRALQTQVVVKFYLSANPYPAADVFVDPDFCGCHGREEVC
jgi:hypothetical protein